MFHLSKNSFLGIVFIFLFQLVSAQELILIDTANHKYRKSLSALYKKRVSVQENVFNQSISDRRVRKEVIDAYQEIAEEFIDGIESGNFVYEENYNQLFEGILNQLASANPQYNTIGDTKILLSYGAQPNAYAIGNEIVVIYLPLIKQLRNEYELAFVISHEIAHNLLNHSYDGLVNHFELKHSKEIKKQTRNINRKRYNKAKQARGLYREIVYGTTKSRREHERQADSLGFVLFNNAFPDKQYEVVRSLEFLNEIDKETDSLLVQDYKRFFDSENLQFKNEWVQNEEISRYNYDQTQKFWLIDSLKTHPDSEIRARQVQTHFNIEEKEPIRASETFKMLKEASEYNEIPGLYALEEYGRSLYRTLLFLKKEPNHPYVKQFVYKNLVKLQDARNSYTLDRYLDGLSPRHSDSYNTFLYFIRNLRRSEMNALIDYYQTL